MRNMEHVNNDLVVPVLDQIRNTITEKVGTTEWCLCVPHTESYFCDGSISDPELFITPEFREKLHVVGYEPLENKFYETLTVKYTKVFDTELLSFLTRYMFIISLENENWTGQK